MENINIEEFGKDHWSTFAYAETLAVDSGNKGWIIPEIKRMRMDGVRYGTRLKTRIVEGHNDFDCLDDFVRIGLLTDEGTGFTRAFKLTELGYNVASKLRRHKAEGGNYKDFKLEKEK